MNTNLRENKRILRSFMRKQYSDERLTMLLDHARAGLLAFRTCCCFIGIPTADHALQPDLSGDTGHYLKAKRRLAGAEDAEWAYLQLYRPITASLPCLNQDAVRRARLIPMILAEIRRRERLRRHAQNPVVEKVESRVEVL